MQGDSIDRMVAEWARRFPELDVSPLQVMGRLLLCAEYAQRALVAALRPLDLSYADFDVLNTLRRRDDPNGTSPGELARSALITSGAMTARLDRLSRAGLVERRPDPDDRRGVLIGLTGRGDELAREALTAVLAADVEFLAPLPTGRQDRLARELAAILRPQERGSRRSPALPVDQGPNDAL